MNNLTNSLAPELQSQLADILHLGKEGVVKAADWLQAQAPDVCNQYLSWYFWSAIAGIVLGAIVLFILPMVYSKGMNRLRAKWEKEQDRYDNDAFLTDKWIPNCICILTGIIISSVNIHNLMYVTIAPKLVLVEFLKNLI